MTTTIRVVAHSHPVLIRTTDRYQDVTPDGVFDVTTTQEQVIGTEYGEASFYSTTTRSISIVDVPEDDPRRGKPVIQWTERVRQPPTPDQPDVVPGAQSAPVADVPLSTTGAPSIHPGLPVAGYQPQTNDKVEAVNEMKQAEEAVLRMVDELLGQAATGFTDPRWLAIGRTHIEQGFMAINRAIFQPSRIALPEDAA